MNDLTKNKQMDTEQANEQISRNLKCKSIEWLCIDDEEPIYIYTNANS